MTTAEAAKRAGVTQRQLLTWQQEGRLTPNDNGRTDNGRRLDWSARDADEAVALREAATAATERAEAKSGAEEALEKLGGSKDVIAAIGRARGLRKGVTKGKVIVAGPRGARIVPEMSLLAKAIKDVGTPTLIFDRSSIP